MRKKILSLLLTVALLGTLCVTPALAAGVTFPDAAQHWAVSSISRWQDAGIAKGDPDGNVRPNDSLTRAEFATILVRLLGLRDNGVDYFTDVQTGDWYAPAIRACAAAGIMNGFEDNTARPNQSITREEAMVMFGRAVGVIPASRPNLSKFTDGDRVSSWAAPYMAPLTDMGILSGMGDGRVAPRDNINRASTFTLLDKAIASYITQPGSYTTSNPNGFVIINTPYDAHQTVTLTGHAAGVTVAPGDTSNLIFDTLTAGTVKVDGPVAISFQSRTDLGTVSLNVPATLEVARNSQVDTIALNNEHAVLDNKGEVDTILANTPATVTNAGTIGSLEADAAVQLKNNGVLKSVTVRANNVILDGRAPQEMTVAKAVTAPPVTSAGKQVVATGNTTPSYGGGGGGGGGSRPASSSVTFLPMDAELYATIGWDGIPALEDMQEDVTFTASGATVQVEGTLKYVEGFTGFNPNESAEQSGHYVALMFKVPASAVGKGTVTMVKAEGSQTNKVFTLTEDVLDAVGSDKVFASIYHVNADSKVQYIVDWDGSASSYAATTYTLTFADATFEAKAVPADVIAANLGEIAGADPSTLPANGLATGYQVKGTVDPADAARVNVTIEAATLKSHANAQGTEGYWIGFGMPNPEKKALTYLVAAEGEQPSEVSSIAGRFQEVDGKAYNTVYFTAQATPTTYTITVQDGDTTVMTYVVTVDVAHREGAAVEKDALAAAIATAEAIDMTGVETSADGSDIPTDKTWVTPAVKNALTKALADAKTVNADETATQAAVNAATKALTKATANWKPQDGTKTEEQPPVQVDKTALTAAIAAATAAKAGVETSTDGSDISTDKKWVTVEQMTALTTAITAAEGVANNTEATQAQVDEAVTALNTAVATFDGQKQDGKDDGGDPPTPPTKYAVTVTAGANGSASASVTEAAEGVEVTLTITPDQGYELDQITSDDVAVADNKFTMPAKAVAITVTFKAKTEEPGPEPTEYDVTVTAGEHGAASATPTKAAAGTEVTLTITPDQGYELDQITSDDVTVADNKFTMPAKAVAITVTFKATEEPPTPPTKYTITVTGGAVDGGLTEAEENTQITVTANAPESGKVFDKWVATGLTLSAEDEVKSPLTFTMPAAAVTLTATYKDEVVEPPTPETKTITLTVAEGVTVIDVDGGTLEGNTITADKDATVTFQLTVADGYTLGEVTGATEADGVYTVNAEAVTIAATKNEEPDPTPVNKETLISTISAAEGQRFNTVVSADPSTVDVGKSCVPTQDILDNFLAAINAAIAVRDNDAATQTDVDKAVEDLNAAVSTFNEYKQSGTKPVDPDTPTE